MYACYTYLYSHYCNVCSLTAALISAVIPFLLLVHPNQVHDLPTDLKRPLCPIIMAIGPPSLTLISKWISGCSPKLYCIPPYGLTGIER